MGKLLKNNISNTYDRMSHTQIHVNRERYRAIMSLQNLYLSVSAFRSILFVSNSTGSERQRQIVSVIPT